MTPLNRPPQTEAVHRARATSPRFSPWSRSFATIVILGALLTATGAITALFASGEHLNNAGRDYANYFITRNLGLAVMLLIMLTARACRALAALMLLTALIQTLDAITALATGRYGLVPIDLAFAAVFLTGTTRLCGRALWRTDTWRDHAHS